MPYNENFSVTQSLDCSTIEVTDTSTNPGGEVILGRKVFLQKADGSYLAPASQNVWVAEVKANGLITVTGIGAVGYNITVKVNDPTLGLVVVGSYVLDSTDTTTTTIATHIATAITANGYTATSLNNVVRIVPPSGRGASMNTGNRLQVAAQPPNETKAIATFRVLSVGIVGDGGSFWVADPLLGNISIGSYILNNTDTTTTLIAAHLASEMNTDINNNGYSATSLADTVSIYARNGLGSTINGGTRLSFLTNTSSAVSATAQLVTSSIPSNGTVIGVQVNDPVLGAISLATYTKISGDTTADILNGKIVTAINTNTIGYTAVYNSPNINITAPASYGSSINYSGSGTGVGFLSATNISYSKTNFNGGANAVSTIPNTITQFVGGINVGVVVPNAITQFSGGVDGVAIAATGLNYYDFSPFIFPTNKITILIPRDYAVSIQQVSTPLSVVNGSVYAITKYFAFTCNLRTFQLGKVSALSGTPTEINNVNFKQSIFNLQLELDNSDNAIANADIQSSQAAIDRAYNLANNQNSYF